MPWRVCIWSDELIEHLDQQGVSCEEFEYALASLPLRQGHTRKTGDPFVVAEVRGKVLMCISRDIDSLYVEPLTAFEVEG